MGILMQGVWGYVTSPYVMWFPVAAAGALAIIAIIAMIYMLSTFTGEQEGADHETTRRELGLADSAPTVGSLAPRGGTTPRLMHAATIP